MRTALLALLAAISFAAQSRADDAADLAAFEGKWVREMTAPDGSVQATLEKEIKGDRETLRIKDNAGNVRVQTAKLRTERRGDLRLLHWSDAVVTEGREKGARIPNGTAVYKWRGKNWVSVIGLSEDQPFAVYVEEWKPADEQVKAK